MITTKWTLLGRRYTGPGYVDGVQHQLALTPIGGGFFLRPDAGIAFLRMRAAAKKDGVQLVVNTAFRTQEEQQKLYVAYLEERGNLAAKPGYSNHQGGIALDIESAGGTNPAYAWLTKNAARFGFTRTVPSEPWHWEYRPQETR